MNKELRELLDRINNKKAEAKKAYDAGDIEKGNKLKDEVLMVLIIQLVIHYLNQHQNLKQEALLISLEHS